MVTRNVQRNKLEDGAMDCLILCTTVYKIDTLPKWKTDSGGYYTQIRTRHMDPDQKMGEFVKEISKDETRCDLLRKVFVIRTHTQVPEF